MSKGSNRRPTDYDKFSDSYDKIFGVSEMVQTKAMEGSKAGPTKQGTVLPVPTSRRAKGKG